MNENQNKIVKLVCDATVSVPVPATAVAHVSVPADATDDKVRRAALPLGSCDGLAWYDRDDSRVEGKVTLLGARVEGEDRVTESFADATFRRGEEGLELVAEEKPTGGRLPPTEVAERWLTVLHDHMGHLERHYRKWLTFRDAPPEVVPAGANHGVVIAGEPGALLAVVTELWTATANAPECWHNRGDEEDD
jgi:hypothetical protein